MRSPKTLLLNLNYKMFFLLYFDFLFFNVHLTQLSHTPLIDVLIESRLKMSRFQTGRMYVRTFSLFLSLKSLLIEV